MKFLSLPFQKCFPPPFSTSNESTSSPNLSTLESTLLERKSVKDNLHAWSRKSCLVFLGIMSGKCMVAYSKTPKKEGSERRSSGRDKIKIIDPFVAHLLLLCVKI